MECKLLLVHVDFINNVGYKSQGLVQPYCIPKIMLT